MKHLRHIAFNAIAALSALLGLAILIPWCVGLIAGEQWTFPSDSSGHYTTIGFGDGRLRYIREQGFNNRLLRGVDISPTKGMDDPTRLGWKGSGLPGLRIHRAPRAFCVTVSCLPLFITCAILPIAWRIRRRSQRRAMRSGLCPQCGYDLRASPERCPECGAIPPTPATSRC